MIEESKRLASYGRNGDNNLVHVSNRELAGIESLTGRRFTRNPHTGLPEAFGFEDILPVIAGVVATVATEGAAAPAVYGALASGATGAAVSAAKGNDMTTALTTGLISGIGSYAGASALGGVAGAAGTAAADAGGAAAGQAVANTAGQSLGQAALPGATDAAIGGSLDGSIGSSLSPSMTPISSGSASVDQLASGYAQPNLDVSSPGYTGAESAYGITQPMSAVNTGASYNTMQPPDLFDRASSNLGSVANNPSGAIGKIGENLTTMDGLRGAGILAGSAYMASNLSSQKKPTIPGSTPWDYNTAIPVTSRPVTMPGADYRPGVSPEWRYFAEGGGIADSKEPVDYDYMAAKEAGIQPQRGGHWPDTYKLPNHMTFSDQSVYSTESNPGGHWQELGRGRWAYEPSETVLRQHTPSEIRHYFQQHEQGNQLLMQPGMASGGLASIRPEGYGTTANIVNEAKAAMVGEHPKPHEAIQRFRDTFGDGAFQTLSERYGNGGKISGAGGGLDDLIPGTIEGKQKVRLADGEFVVSADVVSALGDGSTDQGVRRLHEMMANVRKQKTGTTKQPGRLKSGTIPGEG